MRLRSLLHGHTRSLGIVESVQLFHCNAEPSDRVTVYQKIEVYVRGAIPSGGRSSLPWAGDEKSRDVIVLIVRGVHV